MMTILFLLLFGTIIVGFVLYHFVFSDNGRKNKSGKGAVGPQGRKSGRASGLD